MKSLAPIRLVLGGNRIGKSTIGAYEHCCYALGCHPYKKIRIPNVGFIVTAKPMREGIEKDIVPTIKKLVGTDDILDIKNNPQGTPFKIIWRTGSVSFLMSAEQDDMVFEGTTIDHGWVDEPVRREIFVAIRRGMVTTGGHFWMTCTPLEEPWIYEELYMKKSSDIEVFEGASDENLTITAEEKERFLAILTPEEREARWFGKFRHLSGRVISAYRPEIHRIPGFDVPYHWPTWMSIDPHKRKPHAALFLTVSPQDILYVCNEIYMEAGIREFGEFCLDIGNQYRIVERLADTSIQEDSWERLSAREILAPLFSLKLAQKKNKMQSALLAINQALKDNKLFIMDHCKRTHREFLTHVYRKSKVGVLEEPEDRMNDMIANLRYIIVERPTYSGIAKIQETASGIYKRT